MDPVERAVSLAVRYAEQYLASSPGQARKAAAIDLAQKWLAAHGITLDLALAAAAIEAGLKSEKLHGALSHLNSWHSGSQALVLRLAQSIIVRRCLRAD